MRREHFQSGRCLYSVGQYGATDVFEFPLSDASGAQFHFLPDHLINGLGYADAAWLGLVLQAGGDVYAVTQYVPLSGHENIAQMNADAVLEHIG